MRIFNESKTEELKDFDAERGRLVADVLETERPEVTGEEEKGHYEVVRTYPNGGKDVEWVIDVPGRVASPARVEREDIYVYVPYTDAELERIAISKEIAELKKKLADSDYKAIKFAEGELSESEYAETREQRRGWRTRINALETELQTL